ncbi:MAG: U32 family peptidase [Oscillospiraceae bacterium]|nr:U32 family peptidase [Oscillospiraceae bacterium]
MALELLSPARDLESVKAAMLFGSDAVYVGGNEFGLRANAGFSMNNLSKAVELVHSYNKRIYLTCNIVANNADIDAFVNFVQEVEKIGIDAIIISDLGLFSVAKLYAPNLPIHISTQAGVMNYATANALYHAGAKRVILARELSITEIKQIRLKTPPELELEAFVHGALCMGFSGRCLISSYLTNRDANSGKCAQPCRWSYKVSLTESERPEEKFDVLQDGCNGTYFFNSKDLCMLSHIDKLAEAGIHSFKIEGRAKTAYYTGVVTNAYRAAIDAYTNGKPIPDWVLREVHCVSHRQYSTGFYFSGECSSESIEKCTKNLQNYENSGYVRECDFVAVVDDYCDKSKTYVIIQRNYFTVDDILEIVAPKSSPVQIFIKELRNSKGEIVTIANHATEKMQLCIQGEDRFAEGSFIRRVKKANSEGGV